PAVTPTCACISLRHAGPHRLIHPFPTRRSSDLLEETRAYIRTRLRIAGAKDLGLFSDEAVVRLSAYSGGIPRVINTVCDHCLLLDRKSTRLNSSHRTISYAVFCLKKKS